MVGSQQDKQPYAKHISAAVHNVTIYVLVYGAAGSQQDMQLIQFAGARLHLPAIPHCPGSVWNSRQPDCPFDSRGASLKACTRAVRPSGSGQARDASTHARVGMRFRHRDLRAPLLPGVPDTTCWPLPGCVASSRDVLNFQSRSTGIAGVGRAVSSPPCLDMAPDASLVLFRPYGALASRSTVIGPRAHWGPVVRAQALHRRHWGAPKATGRSTPLTLQQAAARQRPQTRTRPCDWAGLGQQTVAHQPRATR